MPPATALRARRQRQDRPPRRMRAAGAAWRAGGLAGAGRGSAGPATFRRRLAGALGLPEDSDEAQLCRRLRNASALWLLLDDYPRHPDPALDACLDRLLSAASPRVGWWLASRRRPQCNLARLLLEGSCWRSTAACWRSMPTRSPNCSACTGAAPMPLRPGHCWNAAAVGAPRCACACWSAKRRPDRCCRNTSSTSCSTSCRRRWPTPRVPGLAAASRSGAVPPAVRGAAPRAGRPVGAGLPLLADANQRYSLPPAIREAWREAPQRPQRDFHREACEWFAEHGETREAVDQALAADEPETAAGLLQKLTEEQLLHGHNIGMVLALRDELPAALLASTPRLVILNAWTLLYAGRLAEAEDCIGQLARFLPMPSASRQRVLLAQWQGLFGILLHCRGERGAADYLREALEQLPEDAWSQGLICRSALMQLAMIEGRMDQARLIGRDALRLAREHDSLIFEALIELERAQWLEQRGELLRAEGVLDRAQRYLEDLGQQGGPMLGRIALRRARLCLAGPRGRGRALVSAGPGAGTGESRSLGALRLPGTGLAGGRAGRPGRGVQPPAGGRTADAAAPCPRSAVSRRAAAGQLRPDPAAGTAGAGAGDPAAGPRLLPAGTGAPVAALRTGAGSAGRAPIGTGRTLQRRGSRRRSAAARAARHSRGAGAADAALRSAHGYRRVPVPLRTIAPGPADPAQRPGAGGAAGPATAAAATAGSPAATVRRPAGEEEEGSVRSVVGSWRCSA